MKKELANLEQALKHHEEEQMVQRRGMQEEWEKAIRESNVLMIHLDGKSKFFYPKWIKMPRVRVPSYKVHAIGHFSPHSLNN